MSGKHWKIHKFGGSSLADANCFARVADIIAGMPDSKIGVVVSAMRGMTDNLLNLSSLAERDDNTYGAELQEIGQRYSTTAKDLVTGDGLVQLLAQWAQDAKDIEDILQAVAVVKSAPQRSRASRKRRHRSCCPACSTRATSCLFEAVRYDPAGIFPTPGV